MSGSDRHIAFVALNETQPATAWEREIDQLMQQQMITLDYSKRKQLYDRVQR